MDSEPAKYRDFFPYFDQKHQQWGWKERSEMIVEDALHDLRYRPRSEGIKNDLCSAWGRPMRRAEPRSEVAIALDNIIAFLDAMDEKQQLDMAQIHRRWIHEVAIRAAYPPSRFTRLIRWIFGLGHD